MLFWKRKVKNKEVKKSDGKIVENEREATPAASYSVCGEVIEVIYTDEGVHVFFIDNTKRIHHAYTRKPKVYVSEEENKIKVRYTWIENGGEEYYDYEIVELQVKMERIKFQIA